MQLSHGVFGVLDGMSDDLGMMINFIVITAFFSFIAEKVYMLKALIFEMLQTICLIPALWEDINGNLATNGELQTILIEAILQFFHKLFSDLVLLIKSSKSKTLIVSATASDRGNIDHPITEFNECATLYRNIKISQVMQGKLDKFLIAVLAQKLDKALHNLD